MFNLFQSEKRIDILVVCFANYCRSPVAEVILKRSLPNLNIESAGIVPMTDPDMDNRSRQFLVEIQYKPGVHNPSRISKKKVSSSSIIFALDLNVLNFLNNRYKNSKHKIKLLNYHTPDISLADPFKFDDMSYHEVMRNIENSCKEVIEDFKRNE